MMAVVGHCRHCLSSRFSGYNRSKCRYSSIFKTDVNVERHQVCYVSVQSIKTKDNKSSRDSNEKGQNNSSKDPVVSNHWYRRLTKPWKNERGLVDIICNSVIFENDNVIAFNKPSGLPMIGTSSSSSDAETALSDQVSVMSLMPEVKKRLKLKGNMLPVYSTNRLHSGVIIFSKKEEMAKRLRQYFLSTICQKIPYQTFKAVIVGTLPASSSTDDILLKNLFTQGTNLGVIVKTASKRDSTVSKCRFHYDTLSTNPLLDVSLLQIQPTTVRHDSINVFLSHRLSTVLGDHVYSSRVGKFMREKVAVDVTRCAPGTQRLPAGVLRALGFSSSVFVKDIPLHLHCESVTVPTSKRKRDQVTIHAPLPDYFVKTLELLSLNQDSDLDNLDGTSVLLQQ